jgi:hypothetical protein
MQRYCINCGAPILEGAEVCGKCGATIGQPSKKQTMPQSNQPGQTSPMPQQYSSLQPNKINYKIIIAIIAIIAIIVVIVVVLFMFVGGADSRFVGQWEQDYGYGSTVIWEFKSDGSLKLGSEELMMEMGDWSVNGNQLCIDASSIYSGLVAGSSCVNFEFSNNGNTLTLSQSGTDAVVLTKK